MASEILSFSLHETQKYTFTGSIAQKVLERLNYYSEMKEAELSGRISKLRYSKHSWEDELIHEFEITHGMLFLGDGSRLKQRIIEEAGYRSLRIIRAIEVIEDYQTLANAIDKFKHESGIKMMENFIKMKSKYISLLETCEIQSIGVSDTLDELLPRDEEIGKYRQEDRDNITINYLFWDKDEVSKILQELKKTIMEYTIKIDLTNSSGLVVTELHSASIELLGLYSPNFNSLEQSDK